MPRISSSILEVVCAFTAVAIFLELATLTKPQPVPNYEHATLIEVDEQLVIQNFHQHEFRSWLQNYARSNPPQSCVNDRVCLEFWTFPQSVVGTEQSQKIAAGRDHVFLGECFQGKPIMAIMLDDPRHAR